VVNVSDWVTSGKVSVAVIRSTSVVPYVTGAIALCTSLENGLEDTASPGSPPSALPHYIIIAPARKFSCLSMPSSRILEQSKNRGTSGSMDLVVTL